MMNNDELFEEWWSGKSADYQRMTAPIDIWLAACRISKARIATLERKLAETEAMTAIIIRERDALRAEEPPDGYPSWEDWLVGEGVYFSHSRQSGWYVELPTGEFLPEDGDAYFPDYPAALAAAKKEAGHEVV